MKTLAGTGKLVRLILRRDRVIMPLWVLFLVIVVVIAATARFSSILTYSDHVS